MTWNETVDCITPLIGQEVYFTFEFKEEAVKGESGLKAIRCTLISIEADEEVLHIESVHTRLFIRSNLMEIKEVFVPTAADIDRYKGQQIIAYEGWIIKNSFYDIYNVNVYSGVVNIINDCVFVGGNLVTRECILHIQPTLTPDSFYDAIVQR
jgi:hypothetical protein